eukprot:SAG22_NODE_75_length_22256_cov_45.062960_7_plen_173_part_00
MTGQTGHQTVPDHRWRAAPTRCGPVTTEFRAALGGRLCARRDSQSRLLGGEAGWAASPRWSWGRGRPGELFEPVPLAAGRVCCRTGACGGWHRLSCGGTFAAGLHAGQGGPSRRCSTADRAERAGGRGADAPIKLGKSAPSVGATRSGLLTVAARRQEAKRRRGGFEKASTA